MINRLSGYLTITPRGRAPVELKFCNGSTELFARLMNLEQMDQVHEALFSLATSPTPAYLKAIRLYVYAAALYVCLVERLPITFTEWSASEWLDEFGTDAFLVVIDLPERSETVLSAPDSPVTIKQFKANALARLGLLPAAYYDLTPAETVALMDGTKDREIDAWQRTRLVAHLLRNAHFANPITAHEFLPLPGDNLTSAFKPNTPEESFHMLAAAMGASIIVESSIN